MKRKSSSRSAQEVLSESQIYRDFERAFTRGTGLPLSLHAPENPMKSHPSKFSLLKLLSAIMLTMSLICASAIAAPSPSKGDAALKQQVAELQAKIKQLEAALSAHSPQPSASPTMPGMNMSPNTAPAAMPSMTPSGSGTPGAMGMGDMKMGGMPKT